MQYRKTISSVIVSAVAVSGLAVGSPATAAPITSGVSAGHSANIRMASGLSAAPGKANLAGRLSAAPGVTRLAAATTTASKARLSVLHTSTSIRKGESIRLFVTAVNSSGAPVAKKSAKVQYRASSSGSWKTLGSKPTSKSGKVSIFWRAAASGQYRIVVKPSSTAQSIASKTITVSVTSGNRTLADRARVAKNEIGAATSGVKKLSATKAKSNSAKAVSYQNYKSATLVKVSKSSGTKTWIVRGAINTLYRNSGGAGGTYGVPVADAKCGLLESGCVQKFTKGTIYSSSYKSSATGVKVTGAKGEIAAAATSQVGYKKKWTQNPVRHTTKYNTWAGSNWHWCSMFVFWSAAASGNASTIPEVYRIGNFVKWTKENWTTTRTKPKVGDVGFIDTMGAGYPTHASIVVAVNGNQITTIEGNTARQFPSGYRGVSKQVRTISGFEFFARPEY